MSEVVVAVKEQVTERAVLPFVQRGKAEKLNKTCSRVRHLSSSIYLLTRRVVVQGEES